MTDLTDADVARIKAEVVQAWEDFLQGWRELNPEKATAIWHPEHTSVAYDGKIMKYAENLEFARGYMSPLASWEGGWKQVEVRVLGPTVATFQGTYGGKIGFKDGTSLSWSETANWTALMEKTGDGWKASIATPQAAQGEAPE